VTGLDEALFQALNGLAGRWPVLDGLARLVVNDYLAPSTLALMLVWMWVRGATPPQRQSDTAAVLNAIVAQFLANVILKAVNLVYFRPRPFDSDPGVSLLFYRPWDSSFPSNPATFAFAVATAIYLGDRRLGRWALSVAGLWALARVFCGVHYPSDVLAGALLGSSIAFVVSRGFSAWARLRDRLVSLLRELLVA